MIPFVAQPNSAAPSVVCIGAHSDDIEIGCGGTLAELASAWPQARFHCWVFSGGTQREVETRACLSRLVEPQRLELRVFDFRDGFFPAYWQAIKETMRTLSCAVDPALVFTHGTADGHQDHRALAELSWNHFRHHPILEYEIVKYDGDLGRPNLYVPIALATLERKTAALLDCFESQRSKPWFTRSTFEALARLRGVESNSTSGYAEAFYARKVVTAFAAA
jgi:LmbE family N-acetylglucosaminyl deacetylase